MHYVLEPTLPCVFVDEGTLALTQPVLVSGVWLMLLKPVCCKVREGRWSPGQEGGKSLANSIFPDVCIVTIAHFMEQYGLDGVLHVMSTSQYHECLSSSIGKGSVCMV